MDRVIVPILSFVSKLCIAFRVKVLHCMTHRKKIWLFDINMYILIYFYSNSEFKSIIFNVPILYVTKR